MSKSDLSSKSIDNQGIELNGDLSKQKPENIVTTPEKTINELCQEGSLDEIKEYGERDKSKLEESDEYGCRLLHYAARYNQCKIIQYCLDIGFNIDETDFNNETPLHISIRYNCHEAVQMLLENGASPTIRNNNGEGLFHFAAKRGDKELITIIMKNNHTDINMVDKNVRMPLHHACFHGNSIMCETFLNHGADINGKTKKGETALYLATYTGREEIAKLLIKRAKEKNLVLKDFVNVYDINNTRPIHLCASGGRINIIEMLLREKADVDAQRNISGRCFSALHLAAVSGDVKMCKLLLNYGAKIDIRDCDGCTPLHRAAAGNHEVVVKFLLTEGSTLTSTDNKGLTCFLHAVQEGHTLLAEMILKRNTNQIYQRTKKLRCSVHLAVMNKQKLMLMMLLKYGGAKYTNAIDHSGRTPLHCAAALGDVELVRMLLEYGSSPDTVDTYSFSPLHLACEANTLNCVKLLMEKSTITLNLPAGDAAQTALHISCRNGNVALTNFLLKLGADLSCSDVNGDTSLHCAVRSSSLAVCKALLDYYAPCDIQNGNLDTALHEAAKGNSPEIVLLLLDKKAKIDLRNNKDKTFLDLLIDNRNGEMLESTMDHSSISGELEMTTKIEAVKNMVNAHPSVVIAFLDRGITFSEHSPNDPDFAVTYNFSVLDLGPEAGKQRFATLKNLVDIRQEQILAHPLVKKMISRKWTTYGRKLYILGLFLFLLFHLTLCWLIIDGMQNILKPDKLLRHPEEKKGVFIFLFICALLNILKEVFQVFLRGFRYFTNFENWIEVTYYACSLLALSPFIHSINVQKIQDSVYSNQTWQFSILAMFLGWLNLVLYLRSYMFPTLGLYVTMFFEIFKTFMRISSVVALFILSYANVFYLMFPGQAPFEDIGTSFITVMVMMIGEIGYRETMIDPKVGGEIPFEELSYFLFTIFAITMPIILANLLIGLAVGDIDSVQNNANITLAEMLINYVTEIEEKMPFFIQKRCYEKTFTEKPNEEPSRKVKIINRILWEVTGDPSSNTQKALEQVMTDRFCKGKTGDNQKLFRLENQLNEQKRSIRQLKKILQNQTKMLQEMTENLGIRMKDESNGALLDGFSTLYEYRSNYS